MSKLVRIFRQLRFLEELETGKFGQGGNRDTGLLTVDNLFENPARHTYSINSTSEYHFSLSLTGQKEEIIPRIGEGIRRSIPT